MQRKHISIKWNDFIDAKTYTEQDISIITFIELWKKHHHYSYPTLTLVMTLHLLSDVTYNARQDDFSTDQLYNFVMSNMESNIAFNGEMPGEPIYTLFDEAVQSIKHLLAARRG